MRYMLVEGHGNFGSVDGDPPAAYRYTGGPFKARLSNEMLRDIDKETVDWGPQLRREAGRSPGSCPPVPEPAGERSSGIAVGMANQHPPHNLREVINATICVLENPDATVSQLMEHIQGRISPPGAYHGPLRHPGRLRHGPGEDHPPGTRTEFEEYAKGRIRIIVSELRYQVNKRQLIKNMARTGQGQAPGRHRDIRDETDRNGMSHRHRAEKGRQPQVGC